MGQIPQKYHVSDDGKIFRIDDDGSLNQIGHVDNLDNPKQQEAPYKEVILKKKMPMWGWIVILILCIMCIVLSYIAYNYRQDAIINVPLKSGRVL